MKISLTKLGKRYNRDWIFRKLDFQFEAGKHYAITGPNGSGKSTLLQIISGSSTFNEGSIYYFENGQPSSEKVFGKISYAAPYLDVVEEMTLTEFFSFHQNMKGWLPGLEHSKDYFIISFEKCCSQTDKIFQQWYETKS